MLYLKSVILDKFKSFRNANLLLSKGFTCVVGPNGSGKSVIFDALIFGLGESSLQTLRVDRLDELINRNVKRRQDEPTVAHVKMEFEGDGKSVSITKYIKSDGKSSYRFDGKTMTRKEVVEFLSANGLKVDDTTTIPQGEISRIANLNSNGRRELIDTAAGISEFNEKIKEAMQNLDKVDQKISESNAVLNERLGFLNELEHEKEQAEKFMKLGQRQKALRYSILISRQKELSSIFETNMRDMAILDSKKNDSVSRLNEIRSHRERLNEERQQITNELNKISSAFSETNAKLENITKELVQLEVEIPSLHKSVADNLSILDKSNAESKSLREKVKSNGLSIQSIEKSISALQSKMPNIDLFTDAAGFEKEFKEIDSKISEADSAIIDVQGYISKLQSELSLHLSKSKDIEASLCDVEEAIKSSGTKKSDIQKAIADANDSILKSAAKSTKLKQVISDLLLKISGLDAEVLTFKEQKAIAQSREAGFSGRIASKFSEAEGFYGKASSLCEYDPKYAYAIEAAAASRFEYFVVDSISVANTIIDYLKKNNLGRATFIPIAELNIEKPRKEDPELKSVIDFIKFKPKFTNVFSYIFNNTFLVDNPNEAKKYGIGKHRYVTLEGELIEQSGIISGGSSKRVSLATIVAKINLLEKDKSDANNSLIVAEEELKISDKDRYMSEVKLSSMSSELKSIESDISKSLKQQSSAKDQLKKIEESIKKIKSEIESKDREKLELISVVETYKKDKSMVMSKLSSSTANTEKSKRLKENRDTANKIRDEIESQKIKIAELSKEIEMFNQRISELSATISKSQSDIREFKSALGEKEMRRDVLNKSRDSIMKELKSKKDSSSNSYSRLNSIDSEVGAISQEYGKLEVEISNFERQINDFKITTSQAQTSLNDINAELSTSENTQEIIKLGVDEMQTEVKLITEKLNELGNVNLKAPEVYNEKKKFVEEAQLKVATLQSEKDAVVKAIEEADSKKLQAFMDVLNQVNKNFSRLYNYVFSGKAMILLENEKDPLNSGIYIKINDGKTDIPLKSFSGGQKAMVALMMLFSIHLCKKSSLYLFDEVDAALDPENAKILSKLIKQMSNEAQFIVISHNNSLIVNADAAIGVTMGPSKESNAYGIDIASAIKNKQ